MLLLRNFITVRSTFDRFDKGCVGRGVHTNQHFFSLLLSDYSVYKEGVL